MNLIAAKTDIRIENSGQRLAMLSLWLLLGVLFTFHALSMNAILVDEAEHLHAAWNVSRGQVPYRDFFEHHPPLLWYLTAPLVAGRSTVTPGFVMICRAISAGVTVLMTVTFFVWSRRLLGSLMANFASIALLGIYMYRGGFLDVRPDFTAMLFVFLGMLQLGRRLTDPRPQIDWHIFLSGICFSLAVCLTQKAAITCGALVAWWIGTIVMASATARRNRITQLAVFLFGLAIPISSVICFFTWHGALKQLFGCMVTVNAHWAREEIWTNTWREDANFGFGLYALAGMEVLNVLRSLVADLSIASVRSLVSCLLIFGTAAFLTTPVPFGQSFLFFVVPWVAFLTFSIIGRYLRGDQPIGWNAALLFIVFAGLGLTLDLPVAVKTWTLWAMVMVAGWHLCRRFHAPIVLLLSILAIPMAVAVRTVASDWRSPRNSSANPIDVAIDQYAPPGQPILSMWHIPRPFQPIPVYHWFAHPGVIKSIGGDVLSDEYISAMKSGKVRVAVVSEQDLRDMMPDVLMFLERNATLVARTQSRYSNDVYVVVHSNTRALTEHAPRKQDP